MLPEKERRFSDDQDFVLGTFERKSQQLADLRFIINDEDCLGWIHAPFYQV